MARTARRFWLDIILLQTWTNLLAVGFVIVYLWPVLSFTLDQMLALTVLVASLIAIIMPPYGRMFYGWYKPIFSYLGPQGGESTPRDTLIEAFSIVNDLPRRQFFGSLVLWLVLGFPASSSIYYWFEDFSSDSLIVLAAAVLSASLISGVVSFFALKRYLAPLRLSLARSLPEPALRRSVARPVSVRIKLLVSTSGLILVTMILGVSVANVRGKIDLERMVVRGQEEILQQVASGKDRGLETEATIETLRAPARIVAHHLLLVERTADALAAIDALAEAERRAILEAPSGNGSSLDTKNALSWAPAPGDPGSVLLAMIPIDAMVEGSAQSQLATVGLVIIALIAAIFVANFIARDFSTAIDALKLHFGRISEGNLTVSESYEAEDDLGDLARSVEEMAYSLQSAIALVADAANQVEATGQAIEHASDQVDTTANSQAQSIARVSREMDEINLRSREISGSAEVLTQAVNASSTAVLQLDQVSRGLHEHSSELDQQVTDAAQSMDEMSAKIHEVSENTRALSDVASETVDRADQMVEQSRVVEGSATESDALFRRVVTSAELGSRQVSDTIDGTKVIHGSVGEARRVVRSLAERTEVIDSIVTVIEEIADESSLLALNAAIIAAQAGEHGRAFSVVADQTKGLAQQVRARAREIGDIVTAVTEEAGQAVNLIENGFAAVDRGVALSGEAGVALDAVTVAIGESGDRIHEIVGAVHQQSRESAEVSSVMASLNSELARIRDSSEKQARESQRIAQTSTAIQEIARSVHSHAEDQAASTKHITSNVDEVSTSTAQINAALAAQSEACGQVVAFLEGMTSQTEAATDSASHLKQTMSSLSEQAASLRSMVARFTLSSESTPDS